MKYIKWCIIKFLRMFLKIFYVIPIKENRIYLSSNLGKNISCNPFYIYKYLNKTFPEKFEYIWELRKEIKNDRMDVKIIKPLTIKSIFYIMTSDVVISNDGFGSFIPKRNKQIFINTWHGGGAYKKSGLDFMTDQHVIDKKINEICGKQTDIFISSSKKFTEVMSKAKNIHKSKFLECGMPRNDGLINGMEKTINENIREKYGISKDTHIVLYAPTYRGEEKDAYLNVDLDDKKCLEAAQNRFGGTWVLMVRKHHFLNTMSFKKGIDVSDYWDMQELLFIADIFITDYSSCMWDFSLTKKPGFIYAPDLENYKKDRSFYTKPETWPFSIALNNYELENLILNYDKKSSEEKIFNHHKILGIAESGDAAKIIGQKIYGHCFEKKNVM